MKKMKAAAGADDVQMGGAPDTSGTEEPADTTGRNTK
jgi:hypothetical protein